MTEKGLRGQYDNLVAEYQRLQKKNMLSLKRIDGEWVAPTLMSYSEFKGRAAQMFWEENPEFTKGQKIYQTGKKLAQALYTYSEKQVKHFSKNIISDIEGYIEGDQPQWVKNKAKDYLRILKAHRKDGVVSEYWLKENMNMLMTGLLTLPSISSYMSGS